jgi:hypothetical protein
MMPELKRYYIAGQDMIYIRPNPEGDWLKFSEVEPGKIHCNVVCEYCEGCHDLVPKENYSCFRGRKLYPIGRDF